MPDGTPDKSTDYVLPSSNEESARLERQARLYGGTSFVDPFLDPSTGDVLEVGCGTGFFTHHAAIRLPGTPVTGLDIDAQRIEFARSMYDVPNLSFQHGDLTSLPFEDDRFDLVFCRFVLVHYPNPDEALREMRRVTRPGGRIVVYDMIHDGVWFSPSKPAFDELLSKTLAAMRERGMEPDQGLHLPVAMRCAGLREVQTRVIPHHAMSGEQLFEDHRANWKETVEGLNEILGATFDEELVKKAAGELAASDEPQFLTEITVLVHGQVP